MMNGTFDIHHEQYNARRQNGVCENGVPVIPREAEWRRRPTSAGPTCDVQPVAGDLYLEEDASAALCVVRPAQARNVDHTLLVHVHVTGWGKGNTHTHTHTHRMNAHTHHMWSTEAWVGHVAGYRV